MARYTKTEIFTYNVQESEVTLIPSPNTSLEISYADGDGNWVVDSNSPVSIPSRLSVSGVTVKIDILSGTGYFINKVGLNKVGGSA